MEEITKEERACEPSLVPARWNNYALEIVDSLFLPYESTFIVRISVDSSSGGG